jgi:hypothetical protein
MATIKDLSYVHLSKNEVFFRGEVNADELDEAHLPFFRGVHVSDKQTACMYAHYVDEAPWVSRYILTKPVDVINITPHNISILLTIVAAIGGVMKMKNGITLTTTRAQKVIKDFCNYDTDHPTAPLYINTGITYKKGNSSSLFAQIVCFLGFDGYTIAAHKYRRNSEHGGFFHPEIYICNPRLVLKKSTDAYCLHTAPLGSISRFINSLPFIKR